MALRMQLVDFYKLSRPVQERFIGSVNGGGLPSPILEVRGGPREPLGWVALSGGGLLALLVLYRIGLGDLDSAVAINPAAMIVAYALVLSTIAIGLLKALSVWKEVRELPYRPGIYVFPIGLIDARRHQLHIYPIEELTSAEGPDPSQSFRIAFGPKAKFEFPVRDRDRALEAAKLLSEARGRLTEADQARDSVRPKAMAALDPLHGFASPLMPSTPITRHVPFWALRAPIVAGIVGIVLGLGVWSMRNVGSDDRMFATAKTAGDAQAYRAYLARGSRHKDEVGKVLLPRAELREAEKAATVEAIEKYIKEHPGSKIQGEAVASLRVAMLAELEKAKAPGTLGALQEFAKQHPDSHLEPELKAATDAVYKTARDSYMKTAPEKDPLVPALIDRLLALAQKTKNPVVQVRFRRKISKSMDKGDSMVGKSKFFAGVASLPSRYFDEKHARAREADLGKTITDRFQEAFPKEILSFELGDPVGGDQDEPLPVATMPTLFIEHTTEWSGGAATTERPRGVYVGVGVIFEASFRLPEDPKPAYRFKLAGWRGPDTSLAKDEDRPEEKIYQAAAKDDFDQFAKKFLASFFKPAEKTAK